MSAAVSHSLPMNAGGVTIRPATKEEVARLRPQTQNLLLWVPGTRYFVAVDGTRIVGLCGVTFLGNTCKFRNQFVFPENRGRGIGTALVEYSLWLARLNGCRYAEAVCTPASVGIHLRLGAKTTREYRSRRDGHLCSTAVRFENLWGRV